MNFKFNTSFQIGADTIGENSPTYIVAEMSANHGQDIGKAIEIIHAAKEAGANAIKLQTYTADTLTLDCKSDTFFIKEGPWKGQFMHALYEQAHMPWDWHVKLQEVAASLDLTIFSAPFDPSAVDLLEELNFPAYKIASPELIDLDLIRRVAETGKPVVISTGGGTLAEIHQAVATVKETGNPNLCLLKCTSAYPAPLEEMNLKTIPHLQQLFNCPVGLSDHSLGITVPTTSIALGAKMIEKHFVLSKEDNTADSFFSLTPDEFSAMVKSVREAEKALGAVTYPLETNPARRSLYAVEKIEVGQAFTAQNVRNLRPGTGIPPKHLKNVIGRTAKRTIQRGEALYWDMIG